MDKPQLITVEATVQAPVKKYGPIIQSQPISQNGTVLPTIGTHRMLRMI